MINDILETKFEEVSSSRDKDLSWIGLSQDEIDQIVKHGVNPLAKRTSDELENPGLREFYLMHDPRYIWFATKVLCNINLLPIQSAVLETIWEHPFSLFAATRGFGKTFLLAVYSVLRAALYQGTNIVVVGAAFRQSKLIYEYAERVWNQSPILRSIFRSKSDGPRRDIDRCFLTLGSSRITAVPIGIGGEKIRGLRANIVINDEFDAGDPEIYETVIAGFGAVASNPIENVKKEAKRAKLEKIGQWTEEMEMEFGFYRNQNIISGTCGFSFGHFAKYWNRYKDIIKSGGDRQELYDLLGEDFEDEYLNYNDFSVIRIPADLTPKGFLDAKTIARAKATMEPSTYNREYNAIFEKDSTGFFKRSLIEHCTTRSTRPIKLGDEEITFDARITGDKKLQYVFGIDPASEQDNFSIVILELHKNHSRVVYCWTTNRKDFKKRLSKGLTLEHDYFKFCTRKIRDLMRVFPCSHISMDAQGGGRTIEESLQDPDKLQEGEMPIYPVVDDKKEKDTDFLHGLHILELVQFANAEWTATANYGLKKDMTDLALLFPSINPILLGLAVEGDKQRQELFKAKNVDTDFIPYDTLEDCMMEIEELKNELSNIEVTILQTRERWDVPKIKITSPNVPTTNTSKLSKDRYSALVMANMGARMIQRTAPPPVYQFAGGVVGHIAPVEEKEQLYAGPSWWEPAVNIGKVDRSV